MKKFKSCFIAFISSVLIANPVLATDIDMSSFDMGSIDTSSFGNIDTSSFGNLDTSSFGKMDAPSVGNIDTSSFGDIDMSSFGDIDTSSFGDMGASLGKGDSSKQSLDTGDMSSLKEGFGDLSKEKDGESKDGLSSSSFDDIKSSFDKTSIPLNEDGSLSIDINDDKLMSNFKDIASALGAGEMKELEMPDLGSLEMDITDSMKLNADSTLKSFMGEQYTDLSSSLYTLDMAKSVNVESLNVKYADLLSGMNVKDSYSLNTSEADKAKDGFSGSAVDLFNSSFGKFNLKDGPKDYKIPKSFDSKALIKSNLQSRIKDVEPPKNSAIYQAVASKMSVGNVVSSKKKSGGKKKK